MPKVEDLVQKKAVGETAFLTEAPNNRNTEVKAEDTTVGMTSADKKKKKKGYGEEGKPTKIALTRFHHIYALFVPAIFFTFSLLFAIQSAMALISAFHS